MRVVIRNARSRSHRARANRRQSIKFCPFPGNDLSTGTNFLGSIVVKWKDLFVGYRAGYDTASSKVTKNDVGLAFGYSDVDFHFRCTHIPCEYGLSVMYKGKRGEESARARALPRN